MISRNFLFALAILLAFAPACSLKPDKEDSGVTVSIPGSGAWGGGGRVGGGGGEFQWTGSPPTALNGFSCFFVNIAGPGIAHARDAVEPNKCVAPGMPGFGVLGGMVPVSTGGTLTLNVPPGAGRVVQVLAVQSTIGCPNVNDVLSGAINRNEFGPVYEVGRVVADIHGPATLNIPLSWDQSNPRRFHCVQGVNLAVSIDMVDRGLISSAGSATTFSRTRTSLNTSDYDGQVAYFLEVIAYNNDVAGRNIHLIDSSGAVKATLSMPVTGPTPTRFSAIQWTPNAGADNYRIQTSIGDNVLVYEARMIVRQINATQTKIYIPMLAHSFAGYTASDQCAGGEIDSHTYTGPTGYGSDVYYSYYKHNASVFVGSTTGTEWSLEAVLGNTTTENATAVLYKEGAGQVVESAATVSAGTTPTLATSSAFADSLLTHNSKYEVRFYGASAATHCIFRAGLWRKITNIQAGETRFRISPRMSVTSSTMNTYDRAYLNLSAFSNPSVYYGVSYQGGPAATVKLIDHGANDSGNTGTSEVTGAALSTTASTKDFLISPALSLTDGNRYLTQVDSSPTGELNQSFLVIRFSK